MIKRLHIDVIKKNRTFPRAKCDSSILVVRSDDRCRSICVYRYSRYITTWLKSEVLAHLFNEFNDGIQAYLTEHVSGISAPVLCLVATMHLHGCFRQELINVNDILCTRKWNCRNMKILYRALEMVFLLIAIFPLHEIKWRRGFFFF